MKAGDRSSEGAGSEAQRFGLGVAVRHIAIFTPDLPVAEAYYRNVFEMELVGREVLQKDGLWYSLPFERDWQEAKAAGFDPGMSALRRGSFVLALFQAQATGSQIYVMGLAMPRAEIARVHERLPEGTIVLESGEDGLAFMDPYQITWQISEPGYAFSTAGENSGRWLTF